MRSTSEPARTYPALTGSLTAAAVAVLLAVSSLGLTASVSATEGSLPAGAAPIAGAPARVAAVDAAEAPSMWIHRPTIAGNTRIGSTLRANVVTRGTEPPKLSYVWLRDGVRIGGATSRNYTLKKKDRAHRIAVRVTAAASGVPAMTKTSARTAKIRPRAIDDPTTTQVVVNKQRRLDPKTFTPSGLVAPRISNNGQKLRRVAARALEEMVADARKDGVTVTLLSGYRSYQTQAAVFDAQVRRYGRAIAEQQAARPGHSEHQTGLTGDLGGADGCPITSCFSGTRAGKWLAKHAHRYGFILRYPKGKSAITGFAFEPWHYRYVGTAVSTDMKRKRIATLEEYRGLPAAPRY